jgi:hypothetical protein
VEVEVFVDVTIPPSPIDESVFGVGIVEERIWILPCWSNISPIATIIQHAVSRATRTWSKNKKLDALGAHFKLWNQKNMQLSCGQSAMRTAGYAWRGW